MGFVGTTRLLANIANLVTTIHLLSIRMINLLGAHSWAEVTLGDICRTVSDSAVWPKVLVVLLALGATRLYFSQSIPTAIPFTWPAPKVSSDVWIALRSGSRA
jgi:hypothetical protein